MLITLSRRTAICQSVGRSLVDRCGSPGSCKPQIIIIIIIIIASCLYKVIASSCTHLSLPIFFLRQFSQSIQSASMNSISPISPRIPSIKVVFLSAFSFLFSNRIPCHNLFWFLFPPDLCQSLSGLLLLLLLLLLLYHGASRC